ncbi:hypothetical protein HII31_04076 [Pseudocercospora fuligena]|uniref:Uncharacterized protein n=1 Tax=Pseudocercospora fuligena TaxID=685502 RepID=A0A8H6VPV9_9PEZI|nr:hypothetical protein HII31_04076 [Pseudocercospora fuligena]
MEATTGVPVGAPTGPRADKGKAPMRPESIGHDSAMPDAPYERPEQPRMAPKAAALANFDQSRNSGVRRAFQTLDETDQDMFDAEEALNLGPRNFSGIEQALGGPQEMEVDQVGTNENEADEMETDAPLGSSHGPPSHAPRGPRRQQDQTSKHRTLNMPPRLDYPNTPLGPSRLRNPDTGTRRTSMPPRRNEHTEGRFSNKEQGSRRGRSQTRDEQPRRQNPRSRERGQGAGRSNGDFSIDPRRQHVYSGQRQSERPRRPVNPNAGLGDQRQHNRPDTKAGHAQQGFRNARNHHEQPPHGRNISSASQTQGNVDPYAQARIQNNQLRLNREAGGGARPQVEDTSVEDFKFKGAARRVSSDRQI